MSSNARRSGQRRFALALVLLGCAALAGTLHAAPPQVLQAIPADAAMFAIVPNCEKLNKSIAQLTKSLGIDEPQAADALGSMLGEMGMEKGFDRQGSLAVVMPAFNPMGEPQIIVLAPVSDYNAFVGNLEALAGEPAPPGTKAVNLEGETVFVKPHGKYAVLSNNATLLQNYAPGNNAAGWLKLAGPLGSEALDQADVALMINWPKVGPILQGLVAMTLTQIQQMMEMQADSPVDGLFPGTGQMIKSFFKLYSDFILAYIRDTQAMMLVGQAGQSGIGLSIISQFKAGTPMAQALAQNPSGPLAFDRLPGLPYMLAMAIDMKALPWKSLSQALNQELLQKLPADSPLTELVKVYLQGLDMTQHVRQVQLAWFTPANKDLKNLFNFGYTYTSDQPQALLQQSRQYTQALNKAMAKLVPDDQPNPVQLVYQPNVATVAGRSVDAIQMRFILPSDAATGADDPATAAVMALFGQGINSFLATTDDALVAAQGTGQDTALMARMLAASDRSGDFPAKAGLAALRSQLPGHRIAELYVNLQQIVELIAALKSAGGPNDPAIAMPADTPPLAMSLSCQDNGLNFHIHVPAKTMTAIGQLFQNFLGMAEQDPAEPAVIEVVPQTDPPLEVRPPSDQSPSPKGKVVELTDKNFDDTIGKGLTLVHFRADWSQNCRKQDAILANLAGRYKGKLTVASLNIDVYDQLARKYTPKTVPTLILFKDGKQVGWFIGLTQEQALVKAVDQQLQ